MAKSDLVAHAQRYFKRARGVRRFFAPLFCVVGLHLRMRLYFDEKDSLFCVHCGDVVNETWMFEATNADQEEPTSVPRTCSL